MKALIIGGNGQLGTTLTQTAPESIAYQSLDLPEFDITNLKDVDSVVGDEQPDVIINASAYTAVDRAEEDVELAFSVNATGPENLALAAKKTGTRLIHVSTDYVFDGTACTPYPPEAPCNPIGVYGKSKRQGEVNILSILDNFVIIRTSWLYSMHGNNFVLTILKFMNERDELRVVADQIGAPTWASTLATAIWAVAGNRQLKGIYHWSDAGVASWYDFAVAIQEEALLLGRLNKVIPIHPIRTDQFPTQVTRPSYSVLDSTGSWRDFDSVPMHWRVALKQMLKSL
ncbi:MAG: dTDP-4-dehydrorhamnose reductase [Desulfosarcina sp.]|nr:dTDP-4-dehydrorhamnose reductase [Desulfosarcina sp.]MBC2764917.1 dTDP-4-dehydrorhamnose reductase [Desulfosarcina sp.]